ncbi:uncharacterized protein LOC106757513 [Vigna radiata var. radiata]|uniref:Uncharacterized protein LOC106757513 n=1 Tax=Vigna radiata var. radiata TaxID=3916 RepID=A0A1S3TPI8_VIGRR|nr:uncharacterized protein LOC106757513 [Vigna radiata var. radiata]
MAEAKPLENLIDQFIGERKTLFGFRDCFICSGVEVLLSMPNTFCTSSSLELEKQRGIRVEKRAQFNMAHADMAMAVSHIQRSAWNFSLYLNQRRKAEGDPRSVTPLHFFSHN